MTKIGKGRFALWMFEYDRDIGCFDDDDNITEWSQLPEGEKKVYLEEAEEYLSLDEGHWPCVILKRLGLEDEFGCP